MTKKNVEMYVGDKVYKSKSIKKDISCMDRDQLEELFLSCESISSVVRDKLCKVSIDEEMDEEDEREKKARPIANAFIKKVKAISNKSSRYNSEVTVSFKNLPPVIVDMTFDILPTWNGESFGYDICMEDAKARGKRNGKKELIADAVWASFESGASLCKDGIDLVLDVCPKMKTILDEMKDIEKEHRELPCDVFDIVQDEL